MQHDKINNILRFQLSTLHLRCQLVVPTLHVESSGIQTACSHVPCIVPGLRDRNFFVIIPMTLGKSGKYQKFLLLVYLYNLKEYLYHLCSQMVLAKRSEYLIVLVKSESFLEIQAKWALCTIIEKVVYRVVFSCLAFAFCSFIPFLPLCFLSWPEIPQIPWLK